MTFVTTYGPALILPPGQSASPGKAALQSGLQGGFAMTALFANLPAKQRNSASGLGLGLSHTP